MLIVSSVVIILGGLTVAGYWYWQSKQPTLMTGYAINEEDPVWVKEIMNGTKIYRKWDQREKTVSKCMYQGELVYYITYSGDDLYNDLFEKTGNKICSPSGGFTSNDGNDQCAPFFEDENNCQLIWEKVQ